jgi:hypothetical protein
MIGDISGPRIRRRSRLIIKKSEIRLAGQTSIVIELQQLASNSATPLTELLRKALIVATKLKIVDFRTWIEDELGGYRNKNKEEFPSYRNVTTEIKAFNPYNGLFIPCVFQSPELATQLSQVKIKNSIAEIEEMANNSDSKTFIVDFPPEALHVLRQMQGDFNDLVPRRFVPQNAHTGIVSAVRNMVLSWALKLEEEGIVGEGMTFSENERKKASESANVHIESFHGIYGNVTGHNVQVGDFSAINDRLKQAGISQPERNELETIMDAIKTAKPEDKPSLFKRGIAWVDKNKVSLGILAADITAWFTEHHK